MGITFWGKISPSESQVSLLGMTLIKQTWPHTLKLQLFGFRSSNRGPKIHRAAINQNSGSRNPSAGQHESRSPPPPTSLLLEQLVLRGPFSLRYQLEQYALTRWRQALRDTRCDLSFVILNENLVPWIKNRNVVRLHMSWLALLGITMTCKSFSDFKISKQISTSCQTAIYNAFITCYLAYIIPYSVQHTPLWLLCFISALQHLYWSYELTL